MSLIEWKAEFSVGNAAVDHEHRELIQLINNVHAAISSRANRDRVAAGLGEIYAQIAAHFALEEKMMRDAGYVAKRHAAAGCSREYSRSRRPG